MRASPQTIIAADISDLYPQAIATVLQHGTVVSPRGSATREIVGLRLELTDPRRRLLDVGGRTINPAFAVAEAVWILAGTDDDWIFRYNSALRQYADDGVLRGAYGPRIRNWHGVDQVDAVRRLLSADPDTRRAVVQIFDPAQDYNGARDVPCTLNHRFYLRDGRLQMHTTMRSQDLWLGLPYDMFSNTVLHELVAGWIGVELGSYVHSIDSAHIYDCDVEQAETVVRADVTDDPPADLELTWRDTNRLLDALKANEPLPTCGEGWLDFHRTLRSYEAWKAGEHDNARRLAEGIDGRLGRLLHRWYAHLDGSR